MDRSHRHDSLRSKKAPIKYPEIHIDKQSDFASIRLLPGVESRSYVKNGILFSEDEKGHILEIQILNLSHLQHSSSRKMAA